MSKMSEKLAMDVRSYADIEKGITACSTATFLLYFVFILNEDERNGLLIDIEKEILKLWEEIA